MEPITASGIKHFFQRLGELYSNPIEFYLLGGSALCLLGSLRKTLDMDYTITLAPEQLPVFLSVIDQLAAEMKLDLEHVPLGEFIPLPPDALQRRNFVGRFGYVDVYIYDLYSIALSKIARGFESDIEDVIFMLSNNLIIFDELKRFFQIILPLAAKSDIDPIEFQKYFQEIQRRWAR